MPSTFQKVVVILLLLFGIQFWLVAGKGIYGREIHLLAVLSVMAIALVPPVRNRIAHALDVLRRPTPRVRACTALVVAATSAVALYWSAIAQGRSFHLYIPDEFCYAIQARMIAAGRLWMRAHPLGEAFENFYLLHDPKYASIYFPGTAMLLAPMVWLKLPFWIAPLLLASVIAGLMYRVTTELIDGVAGLVASLLLVSVPMVRWLSLRAMSPIPVIFMGLLMVWAFLGWRRSIDGPPRRQVLWALAIGVFAGWGAICRPLDALCYAMPLGALMLVEWLRSSQARSQFVLSAGSVLAGAAPFLALQLVANVGITGDWRQTPYRLYHDRDAPGAAYGFAAFDPSARPQSVLPQKSVYYSGNIAPTIRDHRPELIWRNSVDARFPMMLGVTTSHPLLLLIVPLGLFAMFRRRVLWALGGVALVLPLMFVPFTFFLPHYAVPAAAGMALLVVAAARLIVETFPRARRYWAVVLPGSLIVLSLTSWKTFNRLAFDDLMSGDAIARIDDLLQTIPEARAIVLFRFDKNRLIDAEPVYNAGVAWPDDARIIRAHALSPELNRKIIAYYAERSPDRAVYRYDEGTGQLSRLGLAGELAGAPTPGLRP